MPDPTFDEHYNQEEPAPIPEAAVAALEGAPAEPDAPDPGSPPASAPANGEDIYSGIENPTVREIMRRKDRLLAEQGEDVRQQREQQNAEIADLRRDMQNRPPIPDLEKSPQAPKQQLGQGAMEFLQMATLLGAIAGGRARTGATGALNAFGAAIKGFTQGKQQEFEEGLAEWKAESQRVKDDNQAKLDRYNLIMSDKKTTMDQKLGLMRLEAAQSDDVIKYNLAQQGQYNQLIQVIQKEEQIHAQFAASQERLAAQAQRAQDAHQQIVDQRDTGFGIADDIVAGKIPPDSSTMGRYRTNTYVMQGLDKAIKAGTFNLTKAKLEWQRSQAEVRALYSPQMIRFMSNADSVVNTMDEVKTLANQMRQNGYPLINKLEIMKGLKINSNSPQGQLTTRYIAAVNTLKEEFTTVISGGYAPREAAWDLANQQINADYGNAQMIATLTELQRLINYRTAAFDRFNPTGEQIGKTGRAAPASGPPPSTKPSGAREFNYSNGQFTPVQ